jgi:hypothetical protein
MKTLEAIQNELAERLTDEVKRTAKMAYLLRIGAFVGECFESYTDKEQEQQLGDFVLVLCEYATIEGLILPHGRHAPPADEMERNQTPETGIALYVGHLHGIQCDAIVEGPKDDYLQDVGAALAQILFYMDQLSQKVAKGQRLLMTANKAYNRQRSQTK